MVDEALETAGVFAGDPGRVQMPGDDVYDETEHERRKRDEPEGARPARREHECSNEGDEKDNARLRCIAKQLEQRADDECAEDDPSLVPGAAENHHRVDGDEKDE